MKANNTTSQNSSKMTILFLTAIMLFAVAFVPGALATHTANVDLQPQWSPSFGHVNYNFNVTNQGPDPIHEVRIYQNYKYTNFTCANAPGWTLINGTKYPVTFYGGNNGFRLVDFCWYYSNNPNTNDIAATQSKIFNFGAITPSANNTNDSCNLQWYFETRDINASSNNGNWVLHHDSTSIDNFKPIIKKTVVGVQRLNNTSEACPNGPDNNSDCYVATTTKITINARDSNESVCQPPSGLAYCHVSVKIDGELSSEYNWTLNPDKDGNVTKTFSFNEDSHHVLNITCTDNAGNVATDVENFTVDALPPQTNLSLSGPQVTQGGATYIDNTTQISLSAADVQPHPSGLQNTYYMYQRVNDSYCTGNNETALFSSLWYINGLTSNQINFTAPFELGQWDYESSLANPGQYAFVNGPATPPMGNGSLMLHVNNGGVAWRAWERGVKLSDISTLQYSTYVPSTNGGTPTFQVEWTTNCSNPVWEGNLIFSPSLNNDTNGNQGVVPDTWQTWNVLNGVFYTSKTGKWYSISSGSPKSWATIKSMYPSACILNSPTGGRIGVKLGSNSGNKTAYVDAIKFNDQVLNFENGTGTQWQVYNGSFNIPNESCHAVQYFSDDNVFNVENTHTATFFVDNQNPTMQKIVGQPSVAFNMTGNPTTICHDVNTTQLGGETLNLTGVGEVVYQVNFTQKCESGIGVGIAYDGKDLWYSCYNSKTDLFKADPLTGQVLASYNLTGGLGALAYDSGRNAIWAGPGGTTGQVYLIHLDSNKNVTGITDAFKANNLGNLNDGLTYDAQDDTLYGSADVSSTIYHYNTNGTLLGSFPAAHSSNSGLAIGGQLLYQGMDGNSHVYVVNKSNTSQSIFDFSTNGLRDEGLECDPNTFASQGDSVMWSMEAYDNGNLRTAFAIKVPAGSCGFGGKPVQVCETTNQTTGIGYYINGSTTISAYCVDPQPHPVGNLNITVLVQKTTDGSNWTLDFAGVHNTTSTSTTEFLKIQDSSLHKLTLTCTNALGHNSTTDVELFKVDNEPPVLSKSLVGPHYGADCPNGTSQVPSNGDENAQCFIHMNGTNSDQAPTQVVLNVTDNRTGTNGIHAIGRSQCTYEVYWDEQPGKPTQTGSFDNSGKVLEFNHDSNHTLYVTCKDGLNNTMKDVEYFRVDGKPPVTVKTYGQPFLNVTRDLGSGEQLYHYMTQGTPVTLTASDVKVGVKYINYTIFKVDVPEAQCYPTNYDTLGPIISDWLKNNDSFTQVYNNTTTFHANEDSCHVILFQGVDKFGNVGPLGNQFVFVDTKAPNGSLTVGKPSLTEGNVTYVTQNTPVTVTCTDPAPHPSGMAQVCVQIKMNDTGVNTSDITQSYVESLGEGWNYNATTGFACKSVTNSKDYTTENATLTFNEDSNHVVTYTCVDQLGNTNGNQSVSFKVDTTAPNTTQTFSGALYQNNGATYMDTYSWINLNSTDGGAICAVGNQSTYYRYTLVNDSYCFGSNETAYDYSSLNLLWNQYTTPFGLPEESCHLIQYYSQDALGNAEQVHNLFVFENKQHPVNNITVGDPQYVHNDSTYISAATPITVSAYDPQPHPSGMKLIEYNWTRVSDDYCYGNVSEGDSLPKISQWTKVLDSNNATFNIPQQSCHMITVYSQNNVDKNTTTQKFVFIDTTAPTTDKKVGEPRYNMTQDDMTNGTIYYPELDNSTGNSICNEAGKCWDVTLLTPINLACNDTGPHPSGAIAVKFKVGLDGSNDTQSYCEQINASAQGQAVYNSTDGYCYLGEGTSSFYFTEETWYKLDYRCIDNVVNEGPVDTEYFKVEGTSFQIDLNKKWNLISVPVKLEDNSMGAVFDSHNDSVVSVWTYNGTDWFVYTPDGVSNDNLNTMLPGYGYWVLNTKADNLTIGGSLFSPGPVGPSSKNIVHGWNLIGYYGTNGAPTVNAGGQLVPAYLGPNGNGDEASCHLYSLGASVWDKAWTSLWTYWETDNPNQWKALDKSSNMDFGAGYWLFANEPGIFVPNTTCSKSV